MTAHYRRRCRTQNVGFPRSFSVVLFWLPLLFGHTAYGDINAELRDAVYSGNTARVEQLLRQGADVNVEQKNGWTVLMDAAKEGRTEIVKVLIEAGADMTKYGDTALMLGVRETDTRSRSGRNRRSLNGQPDSQNATQHRKAPGRYSIGIQYYSSNR